MKVVEDHLKRERDRGNSYATISIHHGPVDVAQVAMTARACGWRPVTVWRGEASVVYMLAEWVGE